MAEATSRLGFLIPEDSSAGPEVTQEGEYPAADRVSYHRSDLDVEEILILSYGGEEIRHGRRGALQPRQQA